MRSALILSVLFCSGALFGAQTFNLTVEAGGIDRKNSIVTVELPVPAESAQKNTATVADAAGNSLPAQVTGPELLSNSSKTTVQLHFILPELKANQTAQFKCSLNGANAPGGKVFKWADTPNDNMELRFDSRPVLKYMYKPLDESSPAARESTFKVFHHVYDPSGGTLLTKGPGGKFTHHRGLFFGYRKVTYPGLPEGCDTWHGGKAHQSHNSLLAQEEGPLLGRHRVAIDWVGEPAKGKSEVFAVEHRELTAYSISGATVIEFASRLIPKLPPIKLDGDVEHAGFHFRAAQEVANKDDKKMTDTYFLRANGKGEIGKAETGKPDLPWNAMSFRIGEQRYTVVYLDRPQNPKPSLYSERTYGRFGSFFKYTIEKDKTLEMKYRIWVIAGETDVATVENRYKDFIEPVKVTVK